MLKREVTQSGEGDWTVAVQGAPLWGANTYLPTAFARVHITPAAEMLGLRRIDDAEPGEFQEAPLTTFDIEKLIRMALHQSVLAFEVLAGPGVGDNIDADFILGAAFSDRLIENMLRSAKGALHGEHPDWQRACRQVLQAAAISRGAAATDVPTLVRTLGSFESLLEEGVNAARIVEKIEKLFVETEHRATLLPLEVPDYQGLNDYLVQLRLKA